MKACEDTHQEQQYNNTHKDIPILPKSDVENISRLQCSDKYGVKDVADDQESRRRRKATARDREASAEV